MRIGLALACFILVAWQSTALAADTATSANETIRDMSPVTVAGVQPGPGMWKVHGPDGHVLWVLGTVSPLPAGLQWKSADVEAVIANADVVLISTDHDDVDYALIAQHAQLVVDTRNVMARRGLSPKILVKA